MLRKLAPQNAYMQPKGVINMHSQNMNHFSHPHQQQAFINPQFNTQPQHIDISTMDANTKREFFGERLFLQISSLPKFANDSE